MSTVVTRNNNVNIFSWRISVAQSDNWNVNVTSFSNGLMINLWIGDDNQSWFTETSLRVIGEGTRGESGSTRSGANEFREFENSALTDVFGGNDADVFWVVNGGDDSGGQVDFFPAFVDIEDMGTGWSTFEHILVHLILTVNMSKMTPGTQQFFSIISFQ